MRTAWGVIVSAALVLGTWAEVGHAFDLPGQQDLIINLKDASCLFKAGLCPEPGTLPLTPQYAALGPSSPLVSAPGLVTGDESRTLFEITAITPSSGGGAFFSPSATEEITGLIYDLRLATTSYTPGDVDGSGSTSAGEGTYTLKFTGAGRNPILGAPTMTGGVIEIYDDTAPKTTTVRNNFPTGPGPNAWLAGSGGHVVGAPATGLPGGADSWAAGQATDDTLWLAGVLTALQCIDVTGAIVACTAPGAIPIVLIESLTFSPDQPNSVNAVSTPIVGFIDVLGGSQQGKIDEGSFGPVPAGTGGERDMQFSLSTSPLFGNTAYGLGPSGAGNTWHLDSSDPIRVRTVPQPASHVLLGLGLLIGFFALRRWGGIVPPRPAV